MKKEYIKYGCIFLGMFVMSLVIITLTLNTNDNNVEHAFDFNGEEMQFVYKENMVFFDKDEERPIQGNQLNIRVEHKDIEKARIILSKSFIDNRYIEPIEIRYDGDKTILLDIDFFKKDIVWNTGFLSSNMFKVEKADNYDVKLILPTDIEVTNNYVEKINEDSKVIFSYERK